MRSARLVPFAYGAVHAAIDATTIAVVFGAIRVHSLDFDDAFWLVVGYDLLAFASQALLGLVTDRLRAPRATAAIGVLVTMASLAVMPMHALAAMLLAGAGNALFHVGGGALSLAVEPGRASAAGVFVGPGALGLAIGLWVGKGGPFATWPFFLALAVALALVASVRPVGEPYAKLASMMRAPSGGAFVVAALLFSIAVRSFVGLAAAHATPKSLGLSFGLASAAFAGKALGGVLSDRIGWSRVSVGALLVSAPILAFGSRMPAAMIAGMFLFQMTMPVTLAALMLVFPRRPAFTFGLACVALVLGALPTFSLAVARHYTAMGLFALILLSAAALFAGLRRLGAPGARESDAAAIGAGVGG